MTTTASSRSPLTRSTLRIFYAAGASVLAAGTLAIGSAGAAHATTHHVTPVNITHPGRDFMGSTIRSHEKVRSHHVLIAPHVTQLPGLDVSAYQGNVDWSSVASNGAKFAYVKATESTSYQSPNFTQQYNGSYNAGLIRGAYHFAVPSNSGGATQADYFVAHGGGWSKDGKTLPGMLDIEYNPYGAECYGLSQGSMVSWIKAFSDEYHAKTSRWPVIYTTNDWWTTCTGNQGDFSSTNPLDVANYNGSVGTLPYKWSFATFWQFADHGTFPGDQDYFEGAQDRLQALANG